MPASPAFRRLPVNARTLREARWAAAVSQTILAVRAGISLRSVVLAEGGCASRKTIEKIARALNVAPEVLAPGPHAPVGAIALPATSTAAAA